MVNIIFLYEVKLNCYIHYDPFLTKFIPPYSSTPNGLR
jgi:hypothetical protein